MNPSTGHLIAAPLRDLITEGYEPLPPALEPAARKKLRGRTEAYVSLTSGGKLSKHAAQLRKHRRQIAKASRRQNRRS